MAERAIYVERGDDGRRARHAALRQGRRGRALFLDDPGARPGTAAVSGRLAIVGLGPGPAEWMTPEAAAAIAAATDVVGYGPYRRKARTAAGQRAHASDNRAELARARLALALAAEGRAVAVVSGGDPGVFAMAAAVFEAIEEEPRMARARRRRPARRLRHAGGGGPARRAARPRFLRHLAQRQSEAMVDRRAAPQGGGRGRLCHRALQPRVEGPPHPDRRGVRPLAQLERTRRRRSPSPARSGAPTRA